MDSRGVSNCRISDTTISNSILRQQRIKCLHHLPADSASRAQRNQFTPQGFNDRAALHSTESLRYLLQHAWQFGVIAVRFDALDDLQRQSRIAAVQLGHCFTMGPASSHLRSIGPA